MNSPFTVRRLVSVFRGFIRFNENGKQYHTIYLYRFVLLYYSKAEKSTKRLLEREKKVIKGIWRSIHRYSTLETATGIRVGLTYYHGFDFIFVF